MLTAKATTTETPAPGVFGTGTVINPTINGHDESTIQTSMGNPDVGISCEFRGFPGAPALLKRTLKAGWSIDGIADGVDTTNQFEINHSLNGGSSWIATVVRINVNTPDSGAVSVDLAAGQDMSLVRIRDLFLCSATDPSIANTLGVMTISNIRIEVAFADLLI